jgi:hypothetical protein
LAAVTTLFTLKKHTDFLPYVIAIVILGIVTAAATLLLPHLAVMMATDGYRPL